MGMDRRNENGRDEQASAGGAEDEHMARARTLMRSVLAPREAREFVETNLCREHAFRALATVQLAATEFASQAVLSGSGPLEISLSCTRTTVTVAVRYPPSAALARQSLILTDELSTQVIQGISRASGAQTAKDGARRLWCSIATGHISLLPDRDPH